MSEERNEQEELTPIETNEEQDAHDQVESLDNPNDEVQEAKDHGHMSKEEWIASGRKAEDYKTEKEFNLTGEIIALKKELQKRDKDIEEVLKYQQTAIQRQKEAFKQELEARLRQAKEYGDVEEVQKLTQQSVQYNLEQQQEQLRHQAQKQVQVLADFKQRNSDWFNEEQPELLQRAQELDGIIRQQNPYITYEQLAEKIEKQIRFEISQDPKYLKLTAKQVESSRPNISSIKSSVNQSGTTLTESDEKLYHKLTSNEKAMYNIHKRIASKIGEKVSVKEFIEQLNKDSQI